MNPLVPPFRRPGADRLAGAPDSPARDTAAGATRVTSRLDDAIDRYASTIYRLAFRSLGNREEAEHVTERVFREAARALDSLEDESERRAYLLTATCSVVVDVWRTYSSRAVSRPDWTTEAMARAAGVLDRDASSGVARILQRLDPVERRVLVLRLLDGRSVAETGQALGISDASVEWLQHLALRRAADAQPEAHEDAAGRVTSSGYADARQAASGIRHHGTPAWRGRTVAS